jgi:hypothetical protein
MLNPRPICDTLVQIFQAIPPVVDMMNGDKNRIRSFHFGYGTEFRLAETIYKLQPPQILIAYEGTLFAQRDANTLWLHKFRAFLRVANQVAGGSPAPGTSYEDLYARMISGKVTDPPPTGWTPPPVGPDIQHFVIYKNPDTGEDGVQIIDPPNLVHMLDEDGMDYFYVQLNLPEVGDQYDRNSDLPVDAG